MKLFPSLLAATIALSFNGAAIAAKGDKKAVDASIYSGIKLRNMGPAVTGGPVTGTLLIVAMPMEHRSHVLRSPAMLLAVP